MESNTAMITGPIALLASAWTIFKKNLKILAPIAITPTVILLVGQFIGMAGGLALFLGFLISIAGIVFAIAMAPALIDALTKIDSGSGASLKYWSQYKTGFKFFWIVLGLGILQGLIILGSAVLFIIPAIVVGGFVGMYLFARILDGHKGFSAMTESYSLVKGRWWKVFGRILCFVLVYVIAAIVVGLVDLLFVAIFGNRSVISVVLALLLQVILTGIVGPMALIYIYKMYVSLKSTRVPAVHTGTFKKWLIAFLVIGIIAVILIPITGIFAVISGFQDARQSVSGLDSATYNPSLYDSTNR